MSDFTPLQADLAALFDAHGLSPEVRGDWLLVDGLYPAIRARIAGRLLYIELALTEDGSLTELYTVDGGLEMFRDGVFPLLLSAFWNRHNPGMVTRQIIKRDDGPWQVFVGLYLRRIEGERPPVPYLLFETIEVFLREQPLDGDMHWLSTGVTVDEDGPAADIRLDGVRQPALENQICALDWLYDSRDYTLRNAILLVKA
ncbi:DUF6348 family protein [Asticcacaulis sp.]|uniref:DUF6348 family protein n=1 Tax=Asticcacaulis sp. TaxID=1872648 RepID=UPI002C24FB8D|nr:DUF6348 family protein [Asticcacaulis sp.]HTM82724.1 DUF6348 family protein [Asticcacaulis sp.]